MSCREFVTCMAFIRRHYFQELFLAIGYSISPHNANNCSSVKLVVIMYFYTYVITLVIYNINSLNKKIVTKIKTHKSISTVVVDNTILSQAGSLILYKKIIFFSEHSLYLQFFSNLFYLSST